MTERCSRAAKALIQVSAIAFALSGLRPCAFFSFPSQATHVRKVSGELQALLKAPGPKDEAQANALIDQLVEARVPFQPLGRGLWRAVYTRGPKPQWERNAKILPFLDNVAGQDYNIDRMRVVNYGEVLGQLLYFQARGRFSEVSSGERNCPKDYNVDVEDGGLNFLGLPIPLPIKGRGYLRCLYADESLRVFVSPKDSPDRWEEGGLVVVQMPIESTNPSFNAPYRSP